MVKVNVTQSCLTLCDPMDYTVHGILQDRILGWIAVPFSRDLLNPEIEPRSPTLGVDSLPAEPPYGVMTEKKNGVSGSRPAVFTSVRTTKPHITPEPQSHTSLQNHKATHHSRTQATARSVSGHSGVWSSIRYACPGMPSVKSPWALLAETGHMTPFKPEIEEMQVCDQRVQSHTYGLRNTHDEYTI